MANGSQVFDPTFLKLRQICGVTGELVTRLNTEALALRKR
jgi:hypothetical protein